MANTEPQLDLFAAAPGTALHSAQNVVPQSLIDLTALSDEGLIDRLPDAGLLDCQRLMGEIARRQVRSAIGAIEAVALRHVGFGKERIIPEQAASIGALASLGGVEAAQALGRLIMRQTFEGPCLTLAMTTAAQLDAPLPEGIVIGLLRHDAPEIRAAAACCTRRWPKAIPSLIELLDDLHSSVRIAAACALGRMGRGEARPLLMRSLREEPTEAVIEAVAGIGDEELIILLGRLAVQRPDLSGSVRDALDTIDHPRAERVAAGLK